MDFGLSDEQRLLEETFRGWLAEHAPITRLRELIENEGYDRALWTGLAELGAAGVLIPERFGGSELSLLDAVLVAQALGEAVTPTPFLGSAVLAPIALLEAGSAEQQESLLPRIVSGELVVGVALTEVVNRREGAGVELRDGTLHGKALIAIDAPGADKLLVAAGADALLLVAAGAPGLTIERLKTVDDTRRTAELLFDGVRPEAVLGDAASAARAIARMLDAGRVVLAADTLGACDAMLDQAVKYAKQREQFGRVIGSFQAVKHMCAEQAAHIEPARSLLWYAAHAGDALPEEASLMAAHAKALLSEVGRDVATTTTEVHGGVGFTDEQNLHFWFKRIGLDRHLLGGPDLLRANAAELQGFSPIPG